MGSFISTIDELICDGKRDDPKTFLILDDENRETKSKLYFILNKKLY